MANIGSLFTVSLLFEVSVPSVGESCFEDAHSNMSIHDAEILRVLERVGTSGDRWFSYMDEFRAIRIRAEREMLKSRSQRVLLDFFSRLPAVARKASFQNCNRVVSSVFAFLKSFGCFSRQLFVELPWYHSHSENTTGSVVHWRDVARFHR